MTKSESNAAHPSHGKTDAGNKYAIVYCEGTLPSGETITEFHEARGSEYYPPLTVNKVKTGENMRNADS